MPTAVKSFQYVTVIAQSKQYSDIKLSCHSDSASWRSSSTTFT